MELVKRVEQLERKVNEKAAKDVTLADLVIAAKNGNTDGLVVYPKEVHSDGTGAKN